MADMDDNDGYGSRAPHVDTQDEAPTQHWASSTMPGDDRDIKEEDDVGDLGPIPLFASETNQKLDDLVRKKTRLLEQLKKYNVEVKSRVQIMAEHLRNVQQELRHTEALVETRQRAIKTEKHLAQISEREIGRCQQGTIAQREQHEETQDRLNIVQNSIFKSRASTASSFRCSGTRARWNHGPSPPSRRRRTISLCRSTRER